MQVKKRTDVSSTLGPFTTQPTIKPACAGCGYVTTTKKPPYTNGQSVQGGGIALGQQQKFLSNVSPSLGSSNGPIESRFGDIGGGTFPKSGSGSPNQQNVPSLNDGLVAPAFGSPGQGQNNPGNPAFSSQYPQDSNSRQPLSNSQQPSSISSYSDSFANPPNNQNNVLDPSNPVQHTSQITYRNPDPPVKVTDGVIKVPGNPDIPIQDKYPGMTDGLPPGIVEKDITDILYRFNWTVGFQGHYETGYKNGAKVGGYFVNGSDGISRVVTYVADENGYRPKVRIINLGLDSPDTPKDDKTFELKSFEFVWYPVK